MLSGKEKATVLSPLIAYGVFLAYLVFFSERPFLLRWLDGCFGFFVALVFCNILRRGAVEKHDENPESEGVEEKEGSP